MQISDILTIIGILFAVYTLINEREREVIILKFNRASIITLFSLFLLINFFVFFKFYHSWMQRVFPFFFFESKIEPEFWAYPITIVLITFLFFKIFRAAFPLSNNQKVVSFYQDLLNKGEYEIVLQFIEKYHQSDIIKFLTLYSKFRTKKNEQHKANQGNIDYFISNFLVGNKKRKEPHQKLVLSNLIFYRIISREDFIQKIANKSPYFFTQFISYLSFRDFDNEELVHAYLKTLFLSNSTVLRRELKISNQSSDILNTEINEDNKLLTAFFLNLDVTIENIAWKPVADAAKLELELLSENHF